MEFLKSRKFLSVSTVLIVLCMVFMIIRNTVIHNSISNWSGSFCFMVLSAIFAVMILMTYKKHDTNVMKPVIGMLLGVNAYQSINAFMLNVVNPAALQSYLAAGAFGYASLTLDVLDFVLTVAFCFNHLVISSGHNSSRANVRLNKFLCIALCVEYILQEVLCLFIFPAERVIYNGVFYILAACDIFVVLWVEIKLDYFRLAREIRDKEGLVK